MRSFKAFRLLMILCVFFCFKTFGQKEKDTIKVLFIGNSFTYFYNLPQVLSAMSEFSKTTHIETRHSLVGGSTLEDHFYQTKNTKSIEILNTQSFDYVVMNHHSLAAIDGADTFLETSKQMIDLIRSKNATPVFIMTWGYKSNPLMIKTISKAYNEMASRFDVDVVPCGLLFSQVRQWRPDLNLFDDDKHPSKFGTYLNALALFKYFTKEKTTVIPNRLFTNDSNNEKLYLLFLNNEESNFLKDLVEQYDFLNQLK